MPIFILGITPRSGTNFLHRLLCKHPSCGRVTHDAAPEDFLTHHSHHLERYVQSVGWQWSHWGDESDLKISLRRHIGEGIIGFSQSLCAESHVVLKTPSVKGLIRFFDFFPDASLLIIVRDGRSVVASGMEGFGWDFESATRRWAHAARSIIHFSDTADPDRFYITRYEDLNTSTTSELRSIFQFLNLETDSYDFEAASDLPVYGSSFTDRTDSKVSWKPVPKPDDFSSSRRWENWPQDRHDRFNWLAGQELRALGYEPLFATRSTPRRFVLNKARDLSYQTKEWPPRLFQALKDGVKSTLDTLSIRRASKD